MNAEQCAIWKAHLQKLTELVEADNWLEGLLQLNRMQREMIYRLDQTTEVWRKMNEMLATATDALRAALGREPTHAEIADAIQAAAVVDEKDEP